VILHGCTIESRVLVGMGSVLLNSVHVGQDRSSRRARFWPSAPRCRRAACLWGSRANCAARLRLRILKRSTGTPRVTSNRRNVSQRSGCGSRRFPATREIVTSQSNKFQAIRAVRDILPPDRRCGTASSRPRAKYLLPTGTAKFACQFSRRQNCLFVRLVVRPTSWARRCTLCYGT